MRQADGRLEPMRNIQIPVEDIDAIVPGLRALPTDALGDAVDTTLLTADSLGHDDLADALAEFIAVWKQRVGELAEHVGTFHTRVAATADRYQETDNVQADALARLDTIRLPNKAMTEPGAPISDRK